MIAQQNSHHCEGLPEISAERAALGIHYKEWQLINGCPTYGQFDKDGKKDGFGVVVDNNNGGEVSIGAYKNDLRHGNFMITDK